MNGNFEVKKRIVESGNSQVFNNWHENAGVSKEDFLTGLKWLCEDPEPDGRMSRELGCQRDGTLVRLTRKYYDNGDFAGFYDMSKTGYRLWSGVSISVRDHI